MPLVAKILVYAILNLPMVTVGKLLLFVESVFFLKFLLLFLCKFLLLFLCSPKEKVAKRKGVIRCILHPAK